MVFKLAESAQKLFFFLVVFALFQLNACAVVDFADPKSPSVKINNVKPKKIGSSLQRLEIELLIQNPNRFDLQIQGMNFTALVNGEKLAKGNSEQQVTVPGLGEALLEVQVVLGIEELFSQASKVLTQEEEALNYSIGGTVMLENWPSAIPFNVDGEYVNPLSEQ